MDPPGAAPTLTNIYNEDKYFAPPSYVSPSNADAASPNPPQPRGSSNPPTTAPHAQPRHNYPRYHHHEDRRAERDQPNTSTSTTTTNPPTTKTKRRKKHDIPIPALPTNDNFAPHPTTTTTAADHSVPPHVGSTRIEQRTRTKISESLDVSGGGLVHAYDGLGPPSSLGVLEEDGGIGRGERVEGMRREVEGLEREVREVREIGRAL
ncbi:MAG: hypothetical protein OHK93_006143 [Ramalina farinacea]|uniref:Uncharacterized protein n=1 Tax=Ramalina farinacea TaxID=258253 RepID=A0AA43QL03_9LECA|nr:hypothetical protein [Ramalina farinacea]